LLDNIIILCESSLNTSISSAMLKAHKIKRG